MLVYVQGCGDSNGRQSIIWSDAGPITELSADSSGQILGLAIGGVPFGQGFSNETFLAVVGSPEARLATLSYKELIEMGFDREKESVLALAQNLVVYELPTEELPPIPMCSAEECFNGDCLGCCGSGCSGCMGVCTTACEQHDLCVRTGGYPGQCFAQFLAAAASVAECLGSGRTVCCD